MEIYYDKNGRMGYSKDFHSRHGKEWTAEELEYLCKFYEIDGPFTISLALERTEMTILTKVHQLRRIGLFDHYKKRNRFYVSVN